MRYIISLIFCCLFTLSMHAQVYLANKVVNLPKGRYTLYGLMQEVRHQKQLSFSYNAKALNGDMVIVLKGQYTDLDQLFTHLRKQYHIGHHIVGKHIVLYKTKGRKKARRKNVAAIVKTDLPRDTMVLKTAISPEAFIGPLVWEHNVHMLADSSSEIVSAGATALAESSVNTRELFRSRPLKAAPFRLALGLRPFAEAMLYADELFYLNPQLSVGTNGLYISLSYAYRNTGAHLRYGIGYRQELDDKSAIRVYTSWGQPKASTAVFYDSIIPPDSLTTVRIEDAVRSEANLFKAGLVYEYALSKTVGLQVGIVFNHMRTWFYFGAGDQAIALNSLPPKLGISDPSGFEIFKTPYQLQTTISMDKPSYDKSWLGFHAGIVFRPFAKRER
ncbi:hypothetical protein D3C72_646840 [compost metagenome]